MARNKNSDIASRVDRKKFGTEAFNTQQTEQSSLMFISDQSQKLLKNKLESEIKEYFKHNDCT